MTRQTLRPALLLALALAGGAPHPAHAQDALRAFPAAALGEGLTAHGHGEVKAKPDVAYMTVSVTTQSKDQAQAVSDGAVRATATLKALKGAGLTDKDLQTLSYTVQPQYDYQASPPVLTGYQVQNTVQATVRDLTRVGRVIDAATGAGAGTAGGTTIGGVTFDLSDRGRAESLALALAVTSARSKAAVMAQAAGVEMGRLLSLTEGGSPAVQPVYGVALRAAAPSRPETPIADQQITVSADATLVYALGPARPLLLDK